MKKILADGVIELIQNHSIWLYCSKKLLAKNNITGDNMIFLDTLSATKAYQPYIDSLLAGTYKWSIPRRVEIAKIGSSKKRLVYIHSIEDRLVLSVLNEVYGEVFKNEVSKSVFSYREGERTLSAVRYLLRDKDISSKYSVKLDISSYFNSVSQEALQLVIDNDLSPTDGLRTTLHNLLFYNKAMKTHQNHETGEIKDVQIIDEYMSLIPGSSFSSFLANYILKEIDEWLESLPDISYARYSDDMIIFADSRDILDQILPLLLKKLDRLGLSINPDKYTYYNPGDIITFLGLKFWKSVDGIIYIDIADKTAKKMKKKIHHFVKLARNRVERLNKSPDKEVAKVIDRINNLVYRTYILYEGKYGWAFYVYNNINTTKTLRELDFYLADSLRYIYTGKHNKANIKVPKERLVTLGMKSFIEMFNFFKMDRYYYKEKVSELTSIYVDQLSDL